MSGLPELAGKVAVVTGGASGIGRALAVALAAEGAQVVLADVEESALAATASELGVVGIRTDVSDAASVQALADEVVQRFGAVHVVCNNAGVGPVAPIAELTLADWQWLLGVNLWGVIHGVTSFLPLLRRNADGGHLVNTASMAGLLTLPGLGPYSVSKFGVVALSETLAQELEAAGSRVGVTVVCPAFVHTNIRTSTRNRPDGLGGGLADPDAETHEQITRGSRFVEAEDVARAVVAAIKTGRLYVFTHPEQLKAVERRHRAIVDAALG